MRPLRKGKVKDIYELDEERLLFAFSDRVSAFDVVLPSIIPHKGEALCKFTAFWFNSLNTPNHMLELQGRDRMVVKKLDMIPIEFVVRGYLYGSLYERCKKGEANWPLKEPVLAAKLPGPLFDPTTKSLEKDEPISSDQILEKGILKKDELTFLRDKSVELYRGMEKIAYTGGFIIADVKFEFGRGSDGSILLADSLGPDEFRLWSADNYAPGRLQESFDKQPVRDWLVEVGYKEQLDEARRLGRELPEPPVLPPELVKKVSERYIQAYERFSGEQFFSG